MSANKPVGLITGAGQGIGRAIACAFAEAGRDIVLVDIDEKMLRETTVFVERAGAHCLAIHADVSKEEQVKDSIDRAVSRFGRLDTLCNNAGIGISSPVESLSVEAWDRVINVNLRGTFLYSKHAIPYLENQKGSIINIASTRALMSESGTEAYSASKGGIIALTHALAVSLGPRGIRVNAISPGWIETAEWRKQAERRPAVHSDADRLQHPVGRVGHPLDIAKASLFLASSDSGFMTGQNLVIDGGMTVKMIYV